MMRRLKEKWTSKRYGMRLCPVAGWTLTSLRFADDVLLFAPSLTIISRMIGDMAAEAAKYGLHLHPDKTKILHNGHNRCRPPATAKISGMDIDILKTTETTKYLGRMLTFSNPHQVESKNRIAAAWTKFFAVKEELTSPYFSVNDRLRLFQGVVTPTAHNGL